MKTGEIEVCKFLLSSLLVKVEKITSESDLSDFLDEVTNIGLDSNQSNMFKKFIEDYYYYNLD